MLSSNVQWKKIRLPLFYSMVGCTISIIAISVIKKLFGVSISVFANLVGASIGAFGLAFGAYFALLAVDAYGYVREIHKARDDAKKITEKLKTREKDLRELRAEIKNVSEIAYKHGGEIITHLGELATHFPKSSTKKGDDERAEMLKKVTDIRARYYLSNPHLSDKELIPHILSVNDSKDRESLPYLKLILDSPDRGDIVNEVAKDAFRSINDG